MANGIIDLGSNKSNFEGRIVWKSISNGSEYNSSYVEAHLQVRRNDGYSTKGTWSGALQIGGTSNTFSNSSTSISSSWVTMLEFYIQQPHNNDGTGSVYIAGYCNAPSGTSMAGAQVSGNKTVTLDRIPRASSIICAEGNLGRATTININRQSENFTHTITYKFGGNAGTIATKTNNTNISWIIPTSFYKEIPNAKNGQGTITCETYSGNTLIGSSSCNFNAMVLESINKPSISASVEDTNTTTIELTGDSNKIVKYFSNAKVIITATAQNSATIKNQKVVCGDGKSATTATSTLNKVESGSFVVSTSDSRGYSNSATINKTLVNYIKLAITELNIARESSTSNTIKATLKGNYFNSSFGSVPNILALKWRYRIAGGTWSGYTTITAILSGNTFSYSGTLGTVFDYKKVYEFQFVAQDKLVTVINKNGNSVYVQKGDPLIDLYKDNFKVNGNVMLRGFLGQIAGSITGTTTDNFNTALREGEWQINGDGNITGGPHTGNLFGKLIVKVSNGTTHNNSSNWIWQYFLETSGLVYFRNKTNSGAWSSWSIVRRGNITGWKSLYYNATGTTGSITLNETAANFSCIEIYYYKANCGYSSVKIYSPNGKDVNLMLNQLSEKTIFQNLSKRIKISGTSITVDTNTSGYGNVSISKIEVNTENNIYIFSVIGYY